MLSCALSVHYLCLKAHTMHRGGTKNTDQISWLRLATIRADRDGDVPNLSSLQSTIIE
jgi:hypothetical protein